MSALQQWESDWQMMFHPEKCTTIHISTPVTSYTVIHLRVSLAANTLASMLTKIYPGMIYSGVYLPDVIGTGSSSSGGINLDVLMEWYFHQVVQDSVKHY
jgi:hypothetical protein